jgi:hypothetical protein
VSASLTDAAPPSCSSRSSSTSAHRGRRHRVWHTASPRASMQGLPVAHGEAHLSSAIAPSIPAIHGCHLLQESGDGGCGVLRIRWPFVQGDQASTTCESSISCSSGSKSKRASRTGPPENPPSLASSPSRNTPHCRPTLAVAPPALALLRPTATPQDMRQRAVASKQW